MSNGFYHLFDNRVIKLCLNEAMNMKDMLSVEEIIADTTIRNPAKIKQLYLYHNKGYAEIAELLGIKESTVRFNVSSGGYCKVKRGDGARKYGDLRAIIRDRFRDNPDLNYTDICDEIGCCKGIVQRYMRELGIPVTKNRRHGRNQYQTTNNGASSNQKSEDKDQLSDALKKMACNTMGVPESIVNTDPSIMASTRQLDSFQSEFPIVINLPLNHTDIKEDVTKDDENNSEPTEYLDPVKSDPIDKDITKKDSTEDDSKKEDTGKDTFEQKPKERRRRKSTFRDTLDKPYTELEPPFVMYNGMVYELLTGERLRKELRKSLIIKKNTHQ